MENQIVDTASLRNKAIVAKGILRNEEGDILFVRACNRPYLSLPGGICEHLESPTEGLRRELQEEVNLTPTDICLAGVEYNLDGEYDHLTIAFLCPTWTGDIRFNDGEISEAIFLPLETAKSQLKEGLYNKLRVWVYTDKMRIPYMENGRLAG